ncbi:hypothetical protein [Gimesia algae]|uniref:Uncharacterized protein n=1 Tax=Gimesia algae TaxID=2527971 RepID=A0A517VBA8_9PLAN|nr:hypothetical protein [Gimesia algae]QDT90269.1 hypothetical protein Pan161_19190 [Gimesia algae]
MSEEILRRRIKLADHHQPTGKTRHYFGAAAEEMMPPAELKIVQYPHSPGFYLLYCDPYGVEMTDTFHEAIEKAVAQAEWEFRVREDEWEVISRM